MSTTHYDEFMCTLKAYMLLVILLESTKGQDRKTEERERDFSLVSVTVSSESIMNQRNIVQRGDEKIEPVCMKWRDRPTVSDSKRGNTVLYIKHANMSIVRFVRTVEGITMKRKPKKKGKLRNTVGEEGRSSNGAISEFSRLRVGRDSQSRSSRLALIPLYQVAQPRLSKRKLSSFESSTIHDRGSLSGGRHRVRRGRRVSVGACLGRRPKRR
jgi:hypothetical protein